MLVFYEYFPWRANLTATTDAVGAAKASPASATVLAGKTASLSNARPGASFSTVILAQSLSIGLDKVSAIAAAASLVGRSLSINTDKEAISAVTTLAGRSSSSGADKAATFAETTLATRSSSINTDKSTIAAATTMVTKSLVFNINKAVVAAATTLATRSLSISQDKAQTRAATALSVHVTSMMRFGRASPSYMASILSNLFSQGKARNSATVTTALTSTVTAKARSTDQISAETSLMGRSTTMLSRNFRAIIVATTNMVGPFVANISRMMNRRG